MTGPPAAASALLLQVTRADVTRMLHADALRLGLGLLLIVALPLGMMDVAEYRQLEQPLHTGDRFLLYTDGLVDATNAAGEFFTVERVKDAVAAGAHLTTEGAADLILAKTRAWADKVAADDLTMVLVDCV